MVKEEKFKAQDNYNKMVWRNLDGLEEQKLHLLE
jgi:hypothetical protein